MVEDNLALYEQSLLIANELKKRKKVIGDLRKACFKEQLDFIDDPAKLKVAQCTRRAGKSYGPGGIYLTIESIAHPLSTCLYIATTREQARRILLKDVLQDINRRFNIGMTFNLTTLTVKFPNGSLLYLMGLDSKPEEMEKALGQKYRLVIIDEAGSWKQDQRHMVHSVLEPACADNEGTICMLGSPVNNLKSYFYDITGRPQNDPKRAKGWSVHRWSWKQNPFTKDKVNKQIVRLQETNPSIAETPIFKQMYLNMWVVDPSARVYKCDEDRNLIYNLPTEHNFFHSVGVDLGYEDDTAITVGAYADNHPYFYFIYAFKKKKMDITEVAQMLNAIRIKYNPIKWVIDGASKQAVKELTNRHNLPLIPADKRGKSDIIEIMNADFIMGKIKILMPECQILVDEYCNLIWDDKSQKRAEHPGCPNHCADAGLYNWRMAFHYMQQLALHRPPPGSPEALDEWWELEASRAEKKKGQDFAMRDFGKEYGYHKHNNR